jgi:hypothetical protein
MNQAGSAHEVQPITFAEKKFIQKRLDAIITGVPGFTFSIDRWMSMEETLDVLKKKKDDT